MKTTTNYHVFTDGVDDWFEDYKPAKKLFHHFKKDYGCARLYEEIWLTPTDDQDEPIEENCLLAYGHWPY